MVRIGRLLDMVLTKEEFNLEKWNGVDSDINLGDDPNGIEGRSCKSCYNAAC